MFVKYNITLEKMPTVQLLLCKSQKGHKDFPCDQYDQQSLQLPTPERILGDEKVEKKQEEDREFHVKGAH